MKAKTNRFLLGISVIFALFLSSCNNFQTQDYEAENSSDKTFVKLSIQEKSRAAFPEMTTDKITEFTLSGTIDDAENAVIPSINKTWTSTDSATAYAQMSQDKLALSAGSWTFTLTAVAKNGDVVLASYTATKTVTISSGENSLDFELKLVSVNVENEAGAGTLTISITLGSEVSSRVAKMTGKLLNSSGVEVSAEADITGSTYTVNNVDAGLYTAEIRFYADDAKTLLLGTYPEAVNINQLGAVSSISVNSLDKVFNITYKAAVLGQTGFKTFATNTSPVKYTRNGAVSFTRPTAENATFFKWILISNDASSAPADSDYYATGNAVQGIARKTIGDKTYCALFIPASEAQIIDSIAVSNLTTDKAQVGKELTATAKVGENDYAGTVKAWEWYYADGSEHKISSATTNKFVVDPKYYGKKLVAKALPKYTIGKDQEGNITSVSLNESASVPSSELETLKGTLAPDGDITSTYTDVIVRGTQLSTDISKLGSVSGKFKDTNKETFSYQPNNADCQITCVTEATPSTSAPTPSSGTKNVSLTYQIKVKDVDGNFVQAYEDVAVTQKVFVNVKYEKPGLNTPGLPTIYQSNDYAVTYGKLKFGSVNALYQYKVGSDNSDEWRDFPATASEEISLPTSGDFSMYFRYKTQGTKNTAGYIEQSDPYFIHEFNHALITNPENNKTGFGKKVLIKSVSITGDAKVGGTLTATVTPDFTNTGFNFCEDGYGSIAWSWSVGGTSVYTAAGDHTGSSSFTIKNADIDTCWNKQITVKAVFTSAKADGVTNNKESTSSTIGDGSLTMTGTVTNKYSNGTSILAGDTLAISSVDFAGITLKNSLGETVTVDKSRFSSSSITPEKAPDSSGTLTVKFKLKGYSEQSVTVGINVKPAAPSFGGGEGSGGGGSGTQESPFSAAGLGIFDEQPGNIPYGYIRFNYDSYKDNQNLTLAAYEYCTEATVTESSVWNPIIKNAENSDFPGTYDKKKADGTLFPQASPEESGVIYMRYRKRARVNYGISEDYVYYSFAKGYWVNTFDEPIYRTDNTTQIITDADLTDDGRYGSITENSDPVAVALGPCVGTYREQISSIIVQTDGDLGIGTFGNGLKVENSLGKYVSFAWYVDDSTEPAQTGVNEYFGLPATSLSDKYVIRVEATDKLGEVYTATATITISRN